MPPDVSINAADFANMPIAGLMAGFGKLSQPVRPTTNGVVLSSRPQGQAPWLQLVNLASAGYDPGAFTEAFARVDPRVNTSAVLDPSPLARVDAKEAIRRWLHRDDIGQVAAKLLEMSEPTERLLWLRELVLPEFFSAFPDGRIACVTYADEMNSYLAFLTLLQKVRHLQSADPAILTRYAGRTPLSSFGLNVPAELVWLMLSMASVAFFPRCHVVFASCEHRYYLVFIPGRPLNLARGESAYPPVARIVPRMLSMLDSRDVRGGGLFTGTTFVAPNRTYPFDRRTYNAGETYDFLDLYVTRLDGLLKWLCDATNFSTTSGQLDLDFAFQTYLTVYVTVNVTLRVMVDELDNFGRKMGLLDILELYAGLVDVRPRQQTPAWRAHLTTATATAISGVLRTYPGNVGADFEAALLDILARNDHAIEQGLIYGRNADGTVTLPGAVAPLAFDDYKIALMRGLRNTKHGFAIHDHPVLSVHTGDIDNDFPDFAIALWFNFVADRTMYTLHH